MPSEVQTACGTLQTSTGIKSGIEASIHAMRNIFHEEGCDAVMLVDADNAFNRLNRAVSLHNIRHTCPTLATYLANTYAVPSRLFLPGGKHILSCEGTTQGDNCASPFYAVSTKPLVDELKDTSAKQVWFADDASSGGKLQEIYEWFLKLSEIGPLYG